MSADSDDSQGGKSGGGSGHAGYEYQIDVSVWLALDLVLANKFTSELVLEPASHEDLEADVEEEDVPGRLTSTAPLDGYKLAVQAKRRTGDAWTLAGIKALLEHGSDTRPSAVKRLEDPNYRYLLVTSASLNGETRKLKVGQPGTWPKPGTSPDGIVKILPAGAAGRVAIIGGMDKDRLASAIKTLLTERFRVPNARWKDCRNALREEARTRMLGAGGGLWRRIELEKTICAHDGYLADSPELERYVHPTNWGTLLSAIQTRHAALIVGQSGTGKTIATDRLFEELRGKIPGLSRVKITHGPKQLQADKTTPPVLYDIVDPWGKFNFDRDMLPWNEELARAFAHASHERIFVGTTRRDVAQAGHALEGVKPWIVNLESEHYGPDERRRLYRTRIDGLPRDLQTLATAAEQRVLSKLATPYEIQKFFDALPSVDRAKLNNPQRFIQEAIDQAHTNSIESTVVLQIETRTVNRRGIRTPFSGL